VTSAINPVKIYVFWRDITRLVFFFGFKNCECQYDIKQNTIFHWILEWTQQAVSFLGQFIWTHDISF
jgi:hypothetical protein